MTKSTQKCIMSLLISGHCERRNKKHIPAAVADVAFDIAFTLSSVTVLGGMVPSKFKIAMPLTSYIPGAISESTIF